MSIATGEQILAADINNKLANDGWRTIDAAATYQGAAAVYLAGDWTDILKVGWGIRFKQSAGTYKYFYIASFLYNGVDKTGVGLLGGTDYSVANEAITVPEYAITAQDAYGFPTSHDWVTITVLR